MNHILIGLWRVTLFAALGTAVLYLPGLAWTWLSEHYNQVYSSPWRFGEVMTNGCKAWFFTLCAIAVVFILWVIGGGYGH